MACIQYTILVSSNMFTNIYQAFSAYLLGSLSLTGALMAYINKGSVPSLVAGSSVSTIYFAAGYLLSKGYFSGLIVALSASLVLLFAGLGRCVATNFEKFVPLSLALGGLLSTLYYAYWLIR